ncbi:MAG: MOSC domain-containing protein [Tepidiformaceae bacterium]
MPAEAGRITELWRYPVKSMMGEPLTSSEITPAGLIGDRAYALIDSETGKVVSAKNPHRWPDLFHWRALFSEPPQTGKQPPPVQFTMPDGGTIDGGAADAPARLSAALGRDVKLTAQAPAQPELEEYWPDIEGLAHREAVTAERIASAGEGTFFDFSAVHLLTSATLARLSQLYPEGTFDVRRFRPNILVETPAGGEGFVENDWVGKTVVIGDVRLRVLIPCPRCVMTTLSQPGLAADPGILKTAARHNTVPVGDAGAMPSVGVYAVVRQGGRVRVGDSIRVE